MLYPPCRIAAYLAYHDESLLSPVPFTRGSLFLLEDIVSRQSSTERPCSYYIITHVQYKLRRVPIASPTAGVPSAFIGPLG